MGAEALRIFEQALTLSETERAELAAKLLASLDEASDPDAEEAWAAEIAKRAESVARGEEAAAEYLEAIRWYRPRSPEARQVFDLRAERALIELDCVCGVAIEVQIRVDLLDCHGRFNTPLPEAPAGWLVGP